MHLKKCRIFDEYKVRFYAAQIAMALDHLHSLGIIYRDLKPENILVDEDGYVKLTDFGMAKHLKPEEKARTFCGTPEYLAPEIILGEKYNKSCDWWCFGILIYEMLCGIPPFYNENQDRMYELIKFAEIKFPKKIAVSKDAQDIILKLCDKNPNTRLGVKDGLKSFKSHAFFAKIDFDVIYAKKVNAPFKPEFHGTLDTNNFDAEFTNEEIGQSVIPDKNLNVIDRSNDYFKEF